MIVPRDERGSAAVEVVLLAPVVVGMLLLVIFGGRVALSKQAVQSAATDAARVASIARSATEATSAAKQMARTSLANQSLSCVRTQVVVDVGGFSKPVGVAATVSVAVVCEVLTADLSLPGLPGTLTIESEMASALDTYRERGQ